MKLLEWRNHDDLDENLQRVETELQDTFTPIEPHPKFVMSLRQNLLKQYPSVALTPSPPQHQILQTGLLVTGGILGSFLMVLTGVRGLISIIGVLGLLVSWLRQNSQDTLTPQNLAH